MIARIFIYLLLAIVLPDLYVHLRYLRRREDLSKWLHVIWWLPGLLLCAYTIALSMLHNFAPVNILWLNLYLLLVGLVVAPKFVFVLSSIVGLGIRRLFHLHRNWGNYVGTILVVGILYAVIYGSMFGTQQLRVHRLDVSFPNLPQKFDGYRIVQFTDAHVGSIRKDFLRTVVDSINAQRADLVAFTGDLQNMLPREIQPFRPLLQTVRAKDGVFSVLGNHDYSMYVSASPSVKAAQEAALIRIETELGWQLLRNSNAILHREGDSLVIAGEENGGTKRFPAKDDIRKTMQGIGHEAFVVMLQHDPSAWRRSILKESNAQLTLSGHTHGGQLSVFGLRPTQLSGTEDCGIYEDHGRFLYVSSGIGGFVPFRLGMPPEIVVLTLHRTQTKI